MYNIKNKDSLLAYLLQGLPTSGSTWRTKLLCTGSFQAKEGAPPSVFVVLEHPPPPPLRIFPVCFRESTIPATPIQVFECRVQRVIYGAIFPTVNSRLSRFGSRGVPRVANTRPARQQSRRSHFPSPSRSRSTRAPHRDEHQQPPGGNLLPVARRISSRD